MEITGDDNKLHVDAEYASETSFKKPVAHGMLSASFISTIIGTKLPEFIAFKYPKGSTIFDPWRYIP